MKRISWLLVAVLLLGLVGTGAARAEAPIPGDGTAQVRVYELKHLATKEAGVVLRTIFEAGRIAELPERGVLIVADTPAKLDAIDRLLERIDRPATRQRSATAGAAFAGAAPAAARSSETAAAGTAQEGGGIAAAGAR